MGNTSNGISIDATKGAEVYLQYDFSADDSGNAIDFSVAIWLRLDENCKDSAIVLTNKTGQYSGNAQGILLALHESSEHEITLQLNVHDDKNQYPPSDVTGNISDALPLNSWVFVTLTHDATKKH
ncbi:LamG domain-containing protein [Salmonella enterica]|nr:LamG domain-containing protein [Salmonella enterica]EGH7832643.1 LamG domain-containing protein [Salmonella enterica]